MKPPYDPKDPQWELAERNLNSSWPSITCPCCKGDGFELLSDPLWQTLKRVVLCGEVSAAQLHAMEAGRRPEFQIGITGFNTRLIALEKLGFVKRLGKAGKTIIWTVGDRYEP